MKYKAMIKMAMLAAVMFSVNIANAALITGTMGITGAYNTSGGSGQANDTLLTLESGRGSPTGASGTGDIGVTVDFLTPGTIGARSGGDISLASFAPVTNLYTIGGWQLDLSTLDAITDQTDSLLAMNGTGFLSGNNFEATGVNWSFSGGAGSYSMTITAVPVPAAVWLFGSGLLGLVGIARRKTR